MKPLYFLLLALAGLCTPAFAQQGTQPASPATDDEEEQSTENKAPLRIPTGVGNVIVGTNILFANAAFQKGFEASYTVGVSPSAGFFILPNIAVGLAGDFTLQSNKGYRNINYSVSPFARVYFARNNSSRPARPLQAFVQAGIGFGGTNSRYETNNTTETVTTNGYRLSAMPGVDYFINEHVAAELGLSYQFISGKPDAQIIGLNVGFQVFLGR